MNNEEIFGGGGIGGPYAIPNDMNSQKYCYEKHSFFFHTRDEEILEMEDSNLTNIFIYKTNDIALLVIISLILSKVSKIYTILSIPTARFYFFWLFTVNRKHNTNFFKILVLN